MISVYLQEGCGKTFERINDTMPHTCNAWGIGIEYANVPIHIQEMSAVRSSSLLKTSTFSCKDCENTFYMSAEGIKCPRRYKIKNIFPNKQHSAGHCSLRIKKITSRLRAKGDLLRRVGYISTVSVLTTSITCDTGAILRSMVIMPQYFSCACSTASDTFDCSSKCLHSTL